MDSAKLPIPLLLAVSSVFSQNPLQYGTISVNSSAGVITGMKQYTTVYGNAAPVKCFFGIPYAEPPTGARRFSRPVAKAPFKDVYDATSVDRPICYQNMELLQGNPGPIYNQTEDCLLLNIYAPLHATPSIKRAVMIWIHGGGWVVGSSRQWDGSFIASYGDVVVVTLNYRLGPLGYLGT
ncbi:carboxylesterase 3-like [Lineus longissimus]|uniref:carboxylesterase 3-like n=1 Tax=Lineus longissimus TaxID=88925 RepID=UPI00315C6245